MAIRILVADDFAPWLRLISSIIVERTDWHIVGEAVDGFEAVQKAGQLKPDLILLDIGLPILNGLEAARRILAFDPSARILFLSQESSADVIQEALSLGAVGYVHKSSVQSDLLSAIEVVLKGKQFVSRELKLGGRTNPFRHEILFCSDDEGMLKGLIDFIAAALSAGNPAIVWATDSHREGIRQGLYGLGIDVDAALKDGTYISSDVSEPPEPERILLAIKGLREAALRMGKKGLRVALCGERAGIFWAESKTDAALRLEQLLNELADSHDIDILCVYPLPQRQEEAVFKSVCAEHTDVRYQ